MSQRSATGRKNTKPVTAANSKINTSDFQAIDGILKREIRKLGEGTSGSVPPTLRCLRFPIAICDCSIQGIIILFYWIMYLHSLFPDIKSDKEAIFEYEKELKKLVDERKTYEKIIAESDELIAMFDANLAPFHQKYIEMQQEVFAIAEEGKKRHLEGIQVRVQYMCVCLAF